MHRLPIDHYLRMLEMADKQAGINRIFAPDEE
jgi:hypothetical protein